ncbi:unnamed protein product [Knipowitschia caucasica]
MTHVSADGFTTGFLDHSDQPQSHRNGNDASHKQMTHVTADCTTPGSVDHSDQPQSHMNMSFANDAPQKQIALLQVFCPASVPHQDVIGKRCPSETDSCTAHMGSRLCTKTDKDKKCHSKSVQNVPMKLVIIQ